MRRKFPISLPLGSLALTTVPGCGLLSDPLMGEWELKSVSYEGQNIDLDQEYSYEGGCTITSAIGVDLEFDEKDGDEILGEWTSKVTYSIESCESYGYEDDLSETYSYSGDAVAEKEEKGKYEIKLEDPEGEGGDTEFDCELEDGELDCTYSGATWTFEQTD